MNFLINFFPGVWSALVTHPYIAPAILATVAVAEFAVCRRARRNG